MAKVLVFTNSPSIAQEMENSFLEHNIDFKVAHGAHEYSEFLRLSFTEEGEEKPVVEEYNLVVVDSGIFVTKTASEWVDHFYDLIESLEEELKEDFKLHELPFLLMGTEEDFFYIQSVLEGPWDDYILSKPFDSLILIQKINLLLSSSRTATHLVNEMSISEVGSLNLNFEIEKISTFGAVIKAYQPIKLDAVIGLSLNFLDEEQDFTVTSRCFKTEKHPDISGMYRLHLQFLALNDVFRKAIRAWMNKEYAKEKQKALNE